MSQIIISDGKSLPRDIDVTVNVSKPQAEVTTDLSVGVFCTPNATFDHDASRIRFYSTFDAVADDFVTSAEAYKAAQAWFSQSPRAKTFAVARIFEASVAGFLQCGVIGTLVLADWKAVTTGSFTISLNGVEEDVTAVDFSAITDLAGIATVLQTKIRAAGEGTAFTAATVTFDAATNQIRITSGSPGDESTVSYLTAVSPASGVDISGSGFLNGVFVTGALTQSCYTVPGYLPTGIVGELGYIAEAASASGKFVYGWTLDKTYRDTDDAVLAAGWAEAQSAAIMGIVTNSPFALDPSSITDVGYLMNKNGYHRSFCVYHNNAYYYPEVSILAYALSVNYSSFMSTITTKFKVLQGIPTVPMTVSELAVLLNKRINTYTLVGNTSKTFREGQESDDTWFMDDLINLDNFKEELQVEVYNVFLRNKKIPYTANGVALLYTAMAKVCDRYVYNGTFAERPLSEAETLEKGYNTAPAYAISFVPLGSLTVSDRASRKGPPATINANLAGAMHSIDIGVEAYS